LKWHGVACENLVTFSLIVERWWTTQSFASSKLRWILLHPSHLLTHPLWTTFLFFVLPLRFSFFLVFITLTQKPIVLVFCYIRKSCRALYFTHNTYGMSCKAFFCIGRFILDLFLLVPTSNY
jgi:hypothetical protein